MFIVLLKFSHNKEMAKNFMQGHKNWIKQGFADGIFMLVGSIKPQEGGAILAKADTKEQLMERIAADPFVAEDVVSAQVIEIEPNQSDDNLRFLLA